MLSKCKKIVYKCKQKLCGLSEDKNSNRMKLLIREFQETLLKVKDKVDPRIMIYIDYGWGDCIMIHGEVL